MRNSQRAVAAVLGGIVVLMLAAASWIRIVAPQGTSLSGERTSRSYDYANFDGVEISGQWQVTIERGDVWRVAVEAPVEILDNLLVEQDGETLDFGVDGGWWFPDGDEDRPKATITMPTLGSIQLSGQSTVSFSGFEGDRLSLVSSGAADVRASASRFETLSLELSGAGNVDLGEMPVTNADISVSGAANVSLNMAGGRLTGEMSGAGNLDYRGTVSEQSVDQSGLVSIQHRD